MRELRARMRDWRSIAVLTLFLVAMSAFALLDYKLIASQAFRGAVGAAFIGKSLFSGIVTAELVIVSLVAPALTVGAVSGERERQTLDVLLTTPLPSWSIVAGKLLAALAFLILMIVATVPLAFVAFLLGGVAPEDVLLSTALIAVTAIGFGALGLFASSIFRSTWPATVASYSAVLLLVAGTYVGQYFYTSVSGERPPGWFMQVNPFAAAASAVGTGAQGVFPFAPFPLMRPPDPPPAPNAVARPVTAPIAAAVAAPDLWRTFVWIYVLVAALGTIAAGFATKPAYRWRFWTG